MSDAVLSNIKEMVESHPITLFMKGTPDEPMCGFSAQVVHILKNYGTPFHAVNVLDDWDLREGIKEFSSWPTIPQLYVQGKFIGGCDIAMQMHRKGELEPILAAVKEA